MTSFNAKFASALLGGGALAALAAGGAAAQEQRLPQAQDPYFTQAQATLSRVLAQQPNTNRAKNVVLFVGDGMGFSTVTAGRIFEGQQRGVDGESNVLAFEAFPYLAASKTYSSDAQISDSAPTAVAMVTGVKTKNDLIGIDHTASLDSCEDQANKKVTSIFEMAETIGMSTGIVSTARITHATPAATYAHTANRDWETDYDLGDAKNIESCVDIARQLVEWMPDSDGFEVAMGGGRRNFMHEGQEDPEDQGETGRRTDGMDLTQAWLDRAGNSGAFVYDKAGFDKVDPANVDHLLGLFEQSHMEYEADRAKDAAGEPSLAEMTSKAIDILSKNEDGFILLVEGGRVDHASHAGNAYRTLTDLVALNEAVKMAQEKTDPEETLIVVTADHSHSLTINGYAKRGNPILGISIGVDGEPILASDGKPYTTLSYANGPGAPILSMPEGAEMEEDSGIILDPKEGRPDPSKVDTTDMDYIQYAAVPLPSETHAGEDLGIYAVGPWAHLFQGTVEENYIYHVLDYASKISERYGQQAKAPAAEGESQRAKAD